MADPPASIPEHWQMCSVARRFREAVNSTTTMLSEPGSEGVWFKRGTEMRDGSTAANLWYTNIQWEKATSLISFVQSFGRPDRRREGGSIYELIQFKLSLNNLQSTYNFGVALRKLYVDRYAVSSVL